MQACCRAGGACCRSQGPQASGREWRLRFHKRHGFPLTSMSNKSPFSSASHFANIGSSKAGSPTSNPLLLKAQSRQFFVHLKQSHDRNQQPVIQSLDTTILFFASMMQACCRVGGACCRSQGPQASGREWRLRFHKRHGFLSTCRTNFLQGVTFCEHRQLKGWQPHFQPTVATSSISTTLCRFEAVAI